MCPGSQILTRFQLTSRTASGDHLILVDSDVPVVVENPFNDLNFVQTHPELLYVSFSFAGQQYYFFKSVYAMHFCHLFYNTPIHQVSGFE